MINISLNSGKKFDIILSNPPYDRGLHEHFLVKYLDLSNIVISIQPINWLIGIKKNKKICDKINDCYCEFENIDPTKHFNDAHINGQVSINYINQEKTKNIIYDNSKYDSLYDINRFSNDKFLTQFNKIIKPLYEKDNIHNYVKLTKKILPSNGNNMYYEPNPNENWYVIRIQSMLGHAGSDDFYTMYSKKFSYNDICGKYSDLIKKTLYKTNNNKESNFLQFYIPFNTENECKAFYKYCKTDFFRTALYLVKDSQGILIGKRMQYIPWFDFSDEHFSKSPKEIDDWLFEKYNISDEIRKHIEEILPDYYNIR